MSAAACPRMEWSGRAPAPPASKAGVERLTEGARHVREAQHRGRCDGYRFGKNSFHVIGLYARGAIALRQKWSRGQVETRLANMPPTLIGMEACVGAHHLSRRLETLGHDAWLMPAKYVRPYSKGQKNDFRDGEAIAEAVQRPTMKLLSRAFNSQSRHRRRSSSAFWESSWQRPEAIRANYLSCGALAPQ